jgi:hypothetical protein
MPFFPGKENNDIFFQAFFSGFSLVPLQGEGKGSEGHSCDIVSINRSIKNHLV